MILAVPIVIEAGAELVWRATCMVEADPTYS